jgi:acyl carrier protein
MNDNQMQDKVLDILGALAPEVDVHSLKAGVRLRDQLDLDSMDFLNFLIGIDQEFAVEIPEADYAKLATLDQIYGYLRLKLGAKVS